MSLSIEQLFKPIGISAFFTQYYERKPLILNRSEPDIYAGLIDLKDLDFLAANLVWPRLQDLRLASLAEPRTPAPVLGNGLVSMPKLYDAYYQGNSVILEELEKRWPPLAQLYANFEEAFTEQGVPIMAGIKLVNFLTPSNSQALAPHFDENDLFILQLEGEKHWLLYGFAEELSSRGATVPEEKMGPKSHEFTLRKGDLLYLPRGFVHEAQATDACSFHLTLGINRPASWGSVLERLTGSVLSLRRSLRPGTLEQGKLTQHGKQEFKAVLRELMDSPQCDALLDEIRLQPYIKGRLSKTKSFDLANKAHAVRLDTQLVRRPGLQWALSQTEDSATLNFEDNFVRGPIVVRDALRFAAEHNEPFTATELPGKLTENSKLLLAQKLIRNGFLDFY